MGVEAHRRSGLRVGPSSCYWDNEPPALDSLVLLVNYATSPNVQMSLQLQAGCETSGQLEIAPTCVHGAKDGLDYVQFKCFPQQSLNEARLGLISPICPHSSSQ